MTALAAVASLGFAGPAAAVAPQITPVAGPTGTATIRYGAQLSAGLREVGLQWNPGDVDWGTQTPHEWAVEVTPPQGATLTDNTCTGSIADTPDLPSCRFTGSIDGSYTVTITAKAGDLLSADSATTTVDVAKTLNLPGLPRDVKVVSGPSELVVSWQPPTDLGDGLGGYHVEAVLPQADAGSCETSQLTCTIKDLTPGQSYDVWVFAYGTQGDSNPDPAEVHGVKPVGSGTGTPTPPASVPASGGTLTAPSRSLTTDQSVTLSGTGYAADTAVQIVVYSTPTVLKTVTTDGTGAFSTSVTLPAGLTGSHTLVAGGIGPDGTYRYLTLPITATSAGGTGGGLPVTGQSTPKLVAMALLLLAFGAVLVRLTRRRPA